MPRKKTARRGHGWPGGREEVAGTGTEHTRFHSGKQGVESVCDAQCDAISANRIELLTRAVILVVGMNLAEAERDAVLARVIADLTSPTTLTGTGKNFYVGYDKSASGNGLVVTGTGSTLSVKATGADVVVSANVTGTTGDSSFNVIAVADGGLIDANRVLVGSGGQIWGNDGTIQGNTVVGSGGTIAPGVPGLPLGSLAFLGNVDLSQNGGGTLAIDLGASGTSDFIDVSGTLSLANATLDLTVGVQDHGLAYIIAHYGTLLGTFATITGLPGASWYVDYNYQSLNQIAIVSDAVPVPEIDPASFGSALAMLLGSLGLLERRRPRGSHRS